MLRNRVKELREKRGWTLERLAAETGLSITTISRVENHKKGWSPDTLEKLAKALKVKVGELLDASGAWGEAPLVGVVGEHGEIVPPNSKKSVKLKVPAAFGDLIAVTVSGDHLYPRHMHGAVIFFHKDTSEPNDCLGQECWVWLESGTNVLRVVHAGSRKGVFNLMSHNQPPLIDQAIVHCRPLVYTTPAQ